MARLAVRPLTRRRLLFSAALLGVALTGRADAREDAQSMPSSNSHTRLLGAIAGAWGTTGLFGGVTDPGHGTLTMHVGWRLSLGERNRVLLEYALELVPLELAFGTQVGQPAHLSPGETVYGAGVDPLGIEAYFGAGRLRPYATLRTGFRVFTQPVPAQRGTRFNLVLDAGGGLEMRFRERHAVFVGVELHHLSNAGLGDANPSLNEFVLRGGLAWSR